MTMLNVVAPLVLLVASEPLLHQDPPPRPDPSQETTVLDEVVVRGSLRDRIEAFVAEVAAPPKGRYMAAWRDRLCPGVVNLEGQAAQAVLDRISAVAGELDVASGRPGCDPNVVIVFTDDGSGIARALVERDRNIFLHPQLSHFNRDEAALETFMSAEVPVRWWHLSAPMDPQTGQLRIDLSNDLYPRERTSADGRLSESSVDVLYKVIIVVDVDLLNGANLAQLSDYLAMVSLAQVDVEASVDSEDTVLNLFRRPGAIGGLTDWDRSYLRAVYESPSRRRSAESRRDDVADAMLEDRQDQDRKANPPVESER
jgi:hypothetical protein